MSVTTYAPDAALTAGNTLIGDAPAIADIDAPKLTELQASTMIQCATEAFGSGTTVNKRTRKMICDKVGTETVGSRTYTMETLTIMYGDPQDANAFVDSLVLDSTHFFWTRPGLDDSVALAAAQKVLVIKAKIDSVDLRTISNADGDEFAVVVNVSVQDRTQLLVSVVA